MWLLPTLNRVEKLKQCLQSAIDTETTEPCTILIDEIDYKQNEPAYSSLHLPERWSLLKTRSITMAEKFREYLSTARPSYYVGVLNDDHHMVSKGWDKKLIENLDGKNFVSANDRSPRTFMQPVTATAWSMPLLEAVGWPIYPPGFQHLFIDDIWRDLGNATGCWHIAANAVVTHKHVLFGEAERDETHNKVYGEEFPKKPSSMWNADQALYASFMQNDFQEVVKKIKDFQDFLPGQQFRPPNS